MNEIQNKILEIYCAVKDICDKNDIRYYAIGGTALGAERHQGFIPWDDDLDIAIPNSDYSKFLKCCVAQLPKKLKIFDYHNSKHCLIFWNKVHDTNTAFLEKATLKYPDYHYGVFVDIMPMYGIPEDIKKYNSVLKKYRFLNMTKQNSFNQLSWKKSLLKIAMFPINIFLPRTFWLRKIDKYQSKWDFDQSKLVGYTWHIVKKKLIFKREWFNGYYELPFETTTIRCCDGNKDILKQQFGPEYMQLPPENQRVSNHYVKIIDLNHSYLQYDNKGALIDGE